MKPDFSGKTAKKLPLKSEEDVKAILAQLKGNKYTVDKVTKKRAQTKSRSAVYNVHSATGGRKKAEFQSEENDDDRANNYMKELISAKKGQSGSSRI